MCSVDCAPTPKRGLAWLRGSIGATESALSYFVVRGLGACRRLSFISHFAVVGIKSIVEFRFRVFACIRYIHNGLTHTHTHSHIHIHVDTLPHTQVVCQSVCWISRLLVVCQLACTQFLHRRPFRSLSDSLIYCIVPLLTHSLLSRFDSLASCALPCVSQACTPSESLSLATTPLSPAFSQCVADSRK